MRGFTALSFAALVVSTVAAAEPAVDDVMLEDPRLTVPGFVTRYSPDLKRLWIQSLERADAETRRLAAGTISIAHERGMPGLDETIGPLRKLIQSDSDAVVRRAAAQALVTLNAHAAAADLARLSEKDGVLTSLIVEPALAKWDYRPIRDAWLQRLTDPSCPGLLRLLAIDGLGEVREERAVNPLQATVRQADVEPQYRLAAARALAKTRDSGLTPLAKEIAQLSGKDAFHRLLAVELLANHSGPDTIEIVRTLASDADPAVARPALERLFALDAPAARPIAQPWLASGDAALRSVAARVIATQEVAESVLWLQPRLDDRNPGNRRFVCGRFCEWGGRDPLRQLVLEQLSATLAVDSWRGLEQASLAMGVLHHQPAAPRLVELLAHRRSETAIAAAWGLRKIGNRETLPDALKYASSLHAQGKQGLAPAHAGSQLSQLFQWFGEARYGEAEKLLLEYVPKSQLNVSARMAACWALGQLHAKEPDHPLAKTFAERLSDIDPMFPEAIQVRHMSAVNLGRMMAKSQLATLRQFAVYDTPFSIQGQASYWSIEQITGEKAPHPDPVEVGSVNWFLEPNSP